MPPDPTDDKVNIGSGDGLVTKGTKPSFEPMLIKLKIISYHLPQID